MKLTVLLFILTFHCYAKEYAVVTSSDINTLSKAEIRAVFLKKLTRLNNTKLVPVNLPYNNPLRNLFEKEVLNMGKARLKSYWNKQHYLGNRPPLTMKSEKGSVSFVKNVEGAFTYTELKNVDNSLKVLYKWSDEK